MSRRGAASTRAGTGDPGAGDQNVSTYLVRGDDPALVAQEVHALVSELVGDRDHALVVEELGGGGEDLNVGAVVDACLTPPFLVDRRVIVVRDAGRLLTADVPRLVEIIGDPLPSTVLVLVAGGGTVPAPLVKAVNAHGAVVEVATTKAGDRKTWLHEHLRAGPVKLDAGAVDLLGAHVGEDLARVEGLLGALSAAYGEGARITADDLEPYLGEAGAVPRYELTDAIGRGEPGAALRVLHRMLEAGGLAPVQILATLHGHYANMLALDGDDVSNDRDAAAVLGTAPFVAKKALEQSRRLGSARIAASINLIAAADLDVRGVSGLAPEVVVEILVARLAQKTRPASAARPARRKAGSTR
jgi:DNA polymerase III subunit delta